jgi:four helix bundle protein
MPLKGDDILRRLLDFAVRIIRLVSALPRTPAGKHVGGQLLRCGTSPGAHYEEARGAESRADFIHKLAICWKEIRESCYWLLLARHAGLVKPVRLDAIIQEGSELSAILSRSLTTARKSKH